MKIEILKVGNSTRYIFTSISYVLSIAYDVNYSGVVTKTELTCDYVTFEDVEKFHKETKEKLNKLISK